ncbi:MAG: M48 family metallopeptidase [Candidatus Paceibacterota bacterium]
MTVFLVLVIAVGFAISYFMQSGIILYIAVAVAIIMNLVAYWNSDKIALSWSRATPIKRENHLELFRIVENLSITAGLPMPRLYIMHSPQINAFATGRDPNHAAIAVTEGALSRLEKAELEGVIAHELSHIGNRDILVSTVVVVLAGVIAIMTDIFLRVGLFGGKGDDNRGGGGVMLLISLLMFILAPIAASLIRNSVSRKREYLADSSGALLTRYPAGLASALEKIGNDHNHMHKAHNATAHLFISSPFKGKEKAGWFVKLFSTHPPVEDRIRILRGMEVK